MPRFSNQCVNGHCSPAGSSTRLPWLEPSTTRAWPWDRRAPLLIHCFAGISRSTAAAYTVAAALAPDRDEAELAATLRRLSPSATPNIRIVSLADRILGRRGRMIAAIEGIGRGVDATEGVPFRLKID